MNEKKKKREHLITFYVSSIHNYNSHTAPSGEKRWNEYKSFAKENLCNKNDKSMKDEKLWINCKSF